MFESSIAGITIQAPQLDINTVAAGGGSILKFCAGMFIVGPQSAGAMPGPTCYRQGGPLSVTDANVFLGRVRPEFFPAIFGPEKNQTLDVTAARAGFESLTAEVNAFRRAQGGQQQPDMSAEEVALGFIRVANEAMCRPVRALTQAKGYDTSRHVLSCFGGAGPQHACAIAASLGITRVHISRYSSVLSAFGLAMAEVVTERQRPCARELNMASFPILEESIAQIARECVEKLQADGFAMDHIQGEIQNKKEERRLKG